MNLSYNAPPLIKSCFDRGEGYIEKARSNYGLFYGFYKKLEVETDE
jgi:hypothetical protein